VTVTKPVMQDVACITKFMDQNPGNINNFSVGQEFPYYHGSKILIPGTTLDP
jgi:hypothetical protein